MDSKYDDDEIEEELAESEQEAAEARGEARTANNRNFLLALGILGALFVLLTIVLAVLFLNRQRQQAGGPDINATNAVILAANTQTAGAATQARGMLLTPSATLPATITPLLPTATNTRVVALATETPLGPAGFVSPTANAQTQTRTITVPALLTQSARTQTQAAAARLTGTATALPTTGFADEFGLPGLLGLAAGLVLTIVLVRRLRLSTSS